VYGKKIPNRNRQRQNNKRTHNKALVKRYVFFHVEKKQQAGHNDI